MGELDPARIAGGSCAMPQFRVDADHKMRTPGSDDFFVAYAMTFPGNVYGMRVSFYDRTKNAFTSSTDIVPAVKSAESFIFHLTAIDTGSGPVLLYWNDVDGDRKIVTVRGRFVLRENMFSDDFVIAKPFPLIKTVLPGSWFGDYQTASGYRDHFYPMWIEPHGVIRFAEIDITEK